MFVQHLSAGTLLSVSNMASSLGRNFERLSFDPQHVRFRDNERQGCPSVLGGGKCR
jgi:vacuolar protein sorting-associated protein 13B